MRLRLCTAIIADADDDIREAVRRMLDACEIYEPPTPLERLLDYRRLTTEGRDSLRPDSLLPKSIRRMLARTKGRIRGILDLQARHMYVDASLHEHRRTFIHHHEIGHDVLEWHRALFYVTPEWALRPDVRERLEAEANHFAGLSIFQVDDLARWQRGRRLELADLAPLAARYGTSLTATARQYVIEQDLPVALLLGSPDAQDDAGAGVRFYAGLANGAYLERFRPGLLGSGLTPDHPATAVLRADGPPAVVSDLDVIDLRGEPQRLHMETIFNRYDTLTLVHVQGARPRVFGWLPAFGTAARGASRG